ncbi:hypothetical protein EVAR_6551_1 [Eumeta japonica]|uniref:Uncharacterized protein n=1 Tax=Eumeta variegata TaxID=151549 RepID=A0A4C1SQ46_EUMVA|nr:hypothetical protein EVAR_6551_1 [Eumeta japonica]
METIKYVQQPINLKVVKYELNISPPRALNPTTVRKGRKLRIPEVKHSRRESFVPSPPPIKSCSRKRDVLELVEELLDELYSNHPDWNSSTGDDYTQRSVSAASLASQSTSREFADTIERSYLECLDINDLREQLDQWNGRLKENGDRLARCVRARDRLRRQQKRLCAAVTVLLRHIKPDLGLSRLGSRSPASISDLATVPYSDSEHALILIPHSIPTMVSFSIPSSSGLDFRFCSSSYLQYRFRYRSRL